MITKSVALILDNKNRDLDGICLLAKNLVDMGCCVNIVPYNLMQFELYLIDFDFVLFSFIRPYNYALVKEITDAGVPVGILDSEGGVFSDIKIMFNTWPKNISRISNLYYFFWGANLYRHALDNNLLEKDNAFLTGCPRFDVYADFGSRYPSKSLEHKDYILVNTNYPLANPEFNSVANELKQAMCFDTADQRISTLHKRQIEEQAAIIDLVDFLSSRVSKKIIIRPHPFESASYYKERFKHNSSVLVTKGGTVKSVIQNASLIIQRGCSTGFESRLLGKKSLSPDWVPFKSETLVDQGNTFFTSREELLAYVNDFNSATSAEIDNATRSHIEKYFYKIDGNASHRVASKILDLIKKDENLLQIGKFKIKCLAKKFIFVCFGFTNLSFLRVYFSEIRKWASSEKFFRVDDIANACHELGFDLKVDQVGSDKSKKHSRCSIQVRGI